MRFPRGPLGLLLLAALVRALVAVRTPIPGRDGASYLWMAERVAAGDFGAAFRTVFHPVYALLIAPLLAAWPRLDLVAAGQIVAGGLGALAVLPLHDLARRLYGPHAANAACFLYAVGTWFARHPADCMSEGPFYLFVTSATWLVVCCGSVTAALLAGLVMAIAYGTRPEGAALALLATPWLLWRGEHRRALALATSFGATAIVFPIGWAIHGPGFTLTPKALFNLAVGAGRDGDGGVLFYLTHLAREPGHLFESIGYAACALALVGAWRTARSTRRGPLVLLVGPTIAQVLIVPLLKSTIRFFSGFGILLLPLAGEAWSWCRPRFLAWPLVWRVVIVAAVFTPDAIRIAQTQRTEKLVLRELGELLRTRLRPGATLPTAEHRPRSRVEQPFTMCRVELFAGVEPGPPRPLRAEEVDHAFAAATAQIGIVAGEIAEMPAARLAALGYTPMPLPEPLAGAAAARGIRVYERRSR